MVDDCIIIDPLNKNKLQTWFNIPLFSDVAVGAPGSGEGGQVFIYLGQSDGLTTQYVQVIESPFHTLKDPPMFGFSMRGGTDIDDNGYPGMWYLKIFEKN